MWPDINITDVQEPGESSTPRLAGDSWSRWENGVGKVKTHSALSGRQGKRCAQEPHKVVQQWLFDYLLPQWCQRHGTCLGRNTLGSCCQSTHHYRSPVRMVPQTALYWQQGQWAYAENLAHHPHPPLFLLLQHSLMETIKTLRLFMFIVFIFHISVQRSNAKQYWAAVAIWSMLVHPQTHTFSHALPVISFILISTRNWYNFAFDGQGRKLKPSCSRLQLFVMWVC